MAKFTKEQLAYLEKNIIFEGDELLLARINCDIRIVDNSAYPNAAWAAPERAVTHKFTLKDVCDASASCRLRDTDLYKNLYAKLIWNLAQKIGKKLPLSTELTLGDIAISNGREDAINCFKLLPPRVQIMTIMPAVKRVAKFSTKIITHDYLTTIDKWRGGDKNVDLKALRAAVGHAGELTFTHYGNMSNDSYLAASSDASWDAFWAATWAANAVAHAAACEYANDTDADKVKVGLPTKRAIGSALAAAAMGAYGNIPNNPRKAEKESQKAREAERKLQLANIIDMHPPIHMKRK